MPRNERNGRGLDAAQVEALISSHFPQIHVGGRAMLIEEAGARHARVRLKKQDRHLRPGGTVSGPTMFTLADFSVYVAVIASLATYCAAVASRSAPGSSSPMPSAIA